MTQVILMPLLCGSTFVTTAWFDPTSTRFTESLSVFHSIVFYILLCSGGALFFSAAIVDYYSAEMPQVVGTGPWYSRRCLLLRIYNVLVEQVLKLLHLNIISKGKFTIECSCFVPVITFNVLWNVSGSSG